MQKAAQPVEASACDISRLLRAWSEGDEAAREQLLPLVYDELRRRAARYLRRERPGHTLQPTALVHEAYLRLIKQRGVSWQNRAQFFALASQMMRRILVDHARARRAAKRPARALQVTLADAALPTARRSLDLVALDGALDELAAADPRPARIVELRFFGGLTREEIADGLGVSVPTVTRDWRFAKAWLYQRVTATLPSPPTR